MNGLYQLTNAVFELMAVNYVQTFDLSLTQ